jgi:hypothetical protein
MEANVMTIEPLVERNNGDVRDSAPFSIDFLPAPEFEEYLFESNRLGARHARMNVASFEEHSQCLWDRDEAKSILVHKLEAVLTLRVKGTKRRSAMHALLPLVLIGTLVPLIGLMPDSIDLIGYCVICVSMLVVAIAISHAIDEIGGTSESPSLLAPTS